MTFFASVYFHGCMEEVHVCTGTGDRLTPNISFHYSLPLYLRQALSLNLKVKFWKRLASQQDGVSSISVLQG